VKKKLTDKPTKLQTGKGLGGLWAAELDQVLLGKAWNEKWRPALKASATKGVVLDEGDVQKLLDASTTNMGEPAAMFALLDLLESKEFDRIVVDGLGAAHTLRLIDAATQLRKFIALVRGEKPKVAKAAARRPPHALDEFAAKADRFMALLRDPLRFAFHLVALAEPVPEGQ